MSRWLILGANAEIAHGDLEELTLSAHAFVSVIEEMFPSAGEPVDFDGQLSLLLRGDGVGQAVWSAGMVSVEPALLDAVLVALAIAQREPDGAVTFAHESLEGEIRVRGTDTVENVVKRHESAASHGSNAGSRREAD